MLTKVKLIDRLGSDKTVVNAARVSFNKEISEMKQGDKKLIKYLASHGHWTPFGHVQLQFRIAAPVFVARQLGKHQVGLVWNEVSRRYVDTDVSFYTPEDWRKRADNRKQGSSDEVLEINADLFKDYQKLLEASKLMYDKLLEKEVAPEQARMVLPQSMMTEWIWTGSLPAFARVVKLRDHADAQKECADIAKSISNEVEKTEDLSCSWNALIGK